VSRIALLLHWETVSWAWREKYFLHYCLGVIPKITCFRDIWGNPSDATVDPDEIRLDYKRHDFGWHRPLR